MQGKGRDSGYYSRIFLSSHSEGPCRKSGRFFLYRCTHWRLREMEHTFSWDMDRWLFFGGYPGAAAFIDHEEVWSRYIVDSLIETVLAKDVLQLQTINKPTLLRHLFMLSAVHPAQILSYNKMLGQLQDAGNTTTLAHYLKLLETASLISGLELFKGGRRENLFFGPPRTEQRRPEPHRRPSFQLLQPSGRC